MEDSEAVISAAAEGLSNGNGDGCEASPPVDSEMEERKHFQRVINAFRYYRVHALYKIEKNESFITSMTQRQQHLLADYSEHLQKLRVCVDHNQEIIKLILTDVDQLFENINHSELDCATRPDLSEMEKVNSVLRQIGRDWSSVGEQERAQCYQPIIDEIRRQFPAKANTRRSDIRVLVPGAGLGRLAFEIARLGYTCQGNEFALFMLFASNFVLNKCPGVNIYRIYPWCNSHCNNLRAADQSSLVCFPDVNPSSLPPDSNLSMAAGDFLEIYTEAQQWHCVATCFFIDCANNIVQFIEAIYHILKPGGVWINLGPLLYHFADIVGENSIEPPYEHIKSIILSVGFQLEMEQNDVDTAYCQNRQSMLHWSYNSVFFVCRKPSDGVIGH